MRHEGQSLGDEAHYLQSFLQEKLGTLGYQQMWLSTLLLLIHCHGQPILPKCRPLATHLPFVIHFAGQDRKGREGKGRSQVLYQAAQACLFMWVTCWPLLGGIQQRYAFGTCIRILHSLICSECTCGIGESASPERSEAWHAASPGLVTTNSCMQPQA